MKFRDVCFPALAILSIGPVLLWLNVITEVKFRVSNFKRYFPDTGTPQIGRQIRSTDNKSRTEGSASQVKVFCWITTMEKDLKTKIPAVNETWARKCDNKIFIMTAKKMIKNKQIVDLKVPDGRKHLTEKTIAALQHLHDHYLDDHDWFLKSDDDTYIIMENLRYLLSHYNPKEPVYLGHLFKKFSRAGYMSGGAGYVLSKQALRVLVESGYRNGTTCPKNGSDEDVDLAACLYKVGVPVHNTLDRFGRETFHPFSATQHLVGDLPPLLGNWDRNPTKKGSHGLLQYKSNPIPQSPPTRLAGILTTANQLASIKMEVKEEGAECCSELSISYHYTSPNLMRTIDFLLYKTSIYGRNTNQSHFDKFFQIGTVPPLKQPPK